MCKIYIDYLSNFKNLIIFLTRILGRRKDAFSIPSMYKMIILTLLIWLITDQFDHHSVIHFENIYYQGCY